MKPVPVSSITFINSVHVGETEKQFFQAVYKSGKRDFPQFDISIVDMFVRLQCLKTGDVTWAPLMNVKWWKGPEPKAEKAPAVSSSGIHTDPDPQPKPKAKVKL